MGEQNVILRTAIENTLAHIQDQHLQEGIIIKILLSHDRNRILGLQKLDAVHQSVLTSLQFGQYQRAIWYLKAYAGLCEQYLGAETAKEVSKSLQKKLTFV